MPKEFKKNFRTGNTVAHIRKKDNGVYEIRCQINKQRINVSSKSLDEAKRKFINKLRQLSDGSASAEKKHVQPEKPILLGEYVQTWMEKVKTPILKPVSIQNYNYVIKNHILPSFGDTPIKDIKPLDIQELINDVVDDNKMQTAKEIKKILSGLFSYAVASDVITKSPVNKVVVPHYEAEGGNVISREDEKKLVTAVLNGGNKYAQAYVLFIYTGIRRSELASVVIEGDWVHLISAKGKKGYKVKPRSVPVSPMLKPLLPYIDLEEVKKISKPCLTARFKDFFPNNHLHETRHTFITRCQECGIRRELVSLWAGHAADSSITSAVYTHLQTNKELQIEEITKYFYEL